MMIQADDTFRLKMCIVHSRVHSTFKRSETKKNGIHTQYNFMNFGPMCDCVTSTIKQKRIYEAIQMTT